MGPLGSIYLIAIPPPTAQKAANYFKHGRYDVPVERTLIAGIACPSGVAVRKELNKKLEQARSHCYKSE
jgi:hypothetical protein